MSLAETLLMPAVSTPEIQLVMHLYEVRMVPYGENDPGRRDNVRAVHYARERSAQGTAAERSAGETWLVFYDEHGEVASYHAGLVESVRRIKTGAASAEHIPH